jgi:hypothetical protein
MSERNENAGGSHASRAVPDRLVVEIDRVDIGTLDASVAGHVSSWVGWLDSGRPLDNAR